jgi:hypothetical protein
MCLRNFLCEAEVYWVGEIHRFNVKVCGTYVVRLFKYYICRVNCDDPDRNSFCCQSSQGHNEVRSVSYFHSKTRITHDLAVLCCGFKVTVAQGQTFMLPFRDQNLARPGSFMLHIKAAVAHGLTFMLVFQGHNCARIMVPLPTTWQFHVAVSRPQLHTAWPLCCNFKVTVARGLCCHS